MTDFRAIMAGCLAFTLTQAGLSLPANGAGLSESGTKAPAAWEELDYPCLVVDQSLSDALQDFGHHLGLPVDIGAKIEGRVRAYRHDGTAGDFLRHLASDYELDWVIDQGRLAISSSHARIQRSWPATAGSLAAVRTALTAAGGDDSRFPIGFDDRLGRLTLSAPPRHMALAAPVIESVLAAKAPRTVNVIHGRALTGD